MKNSIICLFITVLFTLEFSSCKTDNEMNTTIDTTLYSIDSGYAFMRMSSVNFIPYDQGVWIIKKNDSLCQLKSYNNSKSIDIIQFTRGSKSIYLSYYHRINNTDGVPNGHIDSSLFVSFRKMKWINKDSIVGEYYNTNYLMWIDHGGSYLLTPDSGIVSISVQH